MSIILNKPDKITYFTLYGKGAKTISPFFSKKCTDTLKQAEKQPGRGGNKSAFQVFDTMNNIAGALAEIHGLIGQIKQRLFVDSITRISSVANRRGQR